LPEDLLLIGKIVKPHGLKGNVKIISYAESVSTYDAIKTVYLKDRNGKVQPLHISKALPAGKGMVILALDEIEDVSKAEALRGLELFIDRKDLEEPAEDEYYQHDLIGLEVFTLEGSNLGLIKEIMPTGSNDIMVVKKGKTEHLIPAIKDVVIKVSLTERKVVIRPLEGMLEE